MNTVYLSLGSNLGNPKQNIKDSVELISKYCQAVVLKKSSYYESEPWGRKDQPNFLNQIIIIKTAYESLQLLDAIQKIELKLKRKKVVKWGARTIDIDIISFNSMCMDTKELTIPHKYMCDRKFVLLPLLEVSPDFIHPKTNEHISNIISDCEDDCLVRVQPD